MNHPADNLRWEEVFFALLDRADAVLDDVGDNFFSVLGIVTHNLSLALVSPVYPRVGELESWSAGYLRAPLRIEGEWSHV